MPGLSIFSYTIIRHAAADAAYVYALQHMSYYRERLYFRAFATLMPLMPPSMLLLSLHGYYCHCQRRRYINIVAMLFRHAYYILFIVMINSCQRFTLSPLLLKLFCRFYHFVDAAISAPPIFTSPSPIFM